MTVAAAEQRSIIAIKTITEETGFPPSPAELAEVLNLSLRSVHSSLNYAKRRGRVGYDEDGNLVVHEEVPSS